jgi:hypothetical protein
VLRHARAILSGESRGVHFSRDLRGSPLSKIFGLRKFVTQEPAGHAPETEKRPSRPVAALLLFGVCLVASAYSLHFRRQLEDRFVNDEWFLLGSNLLAFHTLGLGSQPSVLRPPGYPALIALALSISSEVPPFAKDRAHAGDLVGLKDAYGVGAYEEVFRLQALLLAATAVALFLWLGARAAPRWAFWAGLMFGTNPYALVLVGVLNYSVLHMFACVVGCWLVDRATAPWRPWRIAAAGAWWGLAALVRPVTLPLTLFLLPAFFLRSGRNARRAFVGAVLFTAGTAVTVAPWTLRNYHLTGRLIPTNAQMWVTLWGQTLRRLPFDSSHSLWRGVATSDEYRRVYLQATGKEAYDVGSTVHNNRYDYETYIEENVEIEDGFRADALSNLRRQPGVYAYNCARSFLSLNIQMNSVMIRLFRYLQRAERIPKGWFLLGNRQDFLPSASSRLCDCALLVLSLLAVGGAVGAFLKRDAGMWIPAGAYLCMALAHAMIWVDLRYYYLKIPFVIVFAFFAIDRVFAGAPGMARRLAPFVAAGAIGLSVLGTVSVLWPG